MSSISVSVGPTVSTKLANLLTDSKNSFCYATPLLPSSFSLIYIQIDLEVNQMSLFSGSRRTRWDNEIRVRWVLHLHKLPDGSLPLMRCLGLRVCVCERVGAHTCRCEGARARVCVCKNDLTSSIYFANKKVNAGAHVWSFMWQLCIEYMLPLWLWRLLSFAWWINFCRCKPNLAWEKNTKKLSTDWPAVFYLFGGLFS